VETLRAADGEQYTARAFGEERTDGNWEGAKNPFAPINSLVSTPRYNQLMRPILHAIREIFAVFLDVLTFIRLCCQPLPLKICSFVNSSACSSSETSGLEEPRIRSVSL